MRLATIYNNGKETAGIVCSQGIYCIKTLNAYKGTAWETDIMSLIQTEEKFQALPIGMPMAVRKK